MALETSRCTVPRLRAPRPGQGRRPRRASVYGHRTTSWPWPATRRVQLACSGPVLGCVAVSSRAYVREAYRPCQQTHPHRRWTRHHSPPAGKPTGGGGAKPVAARRLAVLQPEPPANVPKRCRNMHATTTRWPRPRAWDADASSRHYTAMPMCDPRLSTHHETYAALMCPCVPEAIIAVLQVVRETIRWHVATGTACGRVLHPL